MLLGTVKHFCISPHGWIIGYNVCFSGILRPSWCSQLSHFRTEFCKWLRGLENVTWLNVSSQCLVSVLVVTASIFFFNLTKCKRVWPVFWQDMRNLRLAYKQEEQSRLEIFENLVTQAFPLSNGLVSTTLRRGLPQIGAGIGIDDLLGSLSTLIFYDLFVFSFLEV